MKNLIKYLLPVCAVLLFSAAASAQSSRDREKNDGSVSGKPNVGIVIVSSAAKATWAVTEFTAKTVGKPVAKAVLLRATPAVTKFALKNLAKEALPLMVRMSVL